MPQIMPSQVVIAFVITLREIAVAAMVKWKREMEWALKVMGVPLW